MHKACTSQAKKSWSSWLQDKDEHPIGREGKACSMQEARGKVSVHSAKAGVQYAKGGVQYAKAGMHVAKSA